MLKDVPPAQLVEAVRVVARVEALLAPSVTRRLLERMAEMLPASSAPPQLSCLSARELEVLRLLATGLSNAELAERLFLAEATVKTHLSSVLRKLERRDRVQAVILAYDAGLVRPAWTDHPIPHTRHRSTQPLAGHADNPAPGEYAITTAGILDAAGPVGPRGQEQRENKPSPPAPAPVRILTVGVGDRQRLCLKRLPRAGSPGEPGPRRSHGTCGPQARPVDTASNSGPSCRFQR